MKKIQLGCGGNRLPGWENHDRDVDVTRPLPFTNGSASHIFAEHLVEHLTPTQAWWFINECFRVLAPGGRLRLAFPDITRIQRDCTPEYCKAVQDGGFGDGSKKDSIQAALICHGHQSVWTEHSLCVVLTAIGFQPDISAYGISFDPVLRNVERHHEVVGRNVAEVETSVVEGLKP